MWIGGVWVFGGIDWMDVRHGVVSCYYGLRFFGFYFTDIPVVCTEIHKSVEDMPGLLENSILYTESTYPLYLPTIPSHLIPPSHLQPTSNLTQRHPTNISSALHPHTHTCPSRPATTQPAPNPTQHSLTRSLLQPRPR